VTGDGVGRLSIGNLQQGGTAFAHIWSRIVIAIVLQILALGIGQF